MNFKKIAKGALIFLRKNAPFILAGVSGVCTVMAVTSAVEETQALEGVDEPKLSSYKKTLIFGSASLLTLGVSTGMSFKRQKKFLEQIDILSKESSAYATALVAAGGTELLAKAKPVPEELRETKEDDKQELFNVFGYWLRADPEDVYNALLDCNDAFNNHSALTLAQIFNTAGEEAPSGTDGVGWYLDDDFWDYNGTFNIGLRIGFDKKLTDDGLEYRDILCMGQFNIVDQKGNPYMDTDGHHTLVTDMPQFNEHLLWMPDYIWY